MFGLNFGMQGLKLQNHIIKSHQFDGFVKGEQLLEYERSVQRHVDILTLKK